MKKNVLFIGGTMGGGVATVNGEFIKLFEEAAHRCALVDTEATKRMMSDN